MEEETPENPDNGDFKDFDEAAKRRPKKTFRVLGKMYTAPAGAPAGTVLMAMRQGGIDRRNTAHVYEFLEHSIGKENLDSMLKDGVDIDMLLEVMDWLSSKWGFHEKSPQGGVATHTSEGEGDTPLKSTLSSVTGDY